MSKEAVFKFVLDGKQGLTTLGSLKGKIIETEQSLKKFKSAINKQGGATAKQAAATAKLEARLRGLRGSYREATNAASGLTKAGLRFRDKMGGAFMSQLKKMGGAIAATFAVRAIINFGKASVEAFDKQEKAQASLLTALKGREDIQQRLIHQAQQLQQTTLFGDEETIKAQSLLAQLGATEDEIVKLTPLVQDFATAQGIDLVGAANLVAKSIGSSTNALQRYGITIEGAVGSQDRLDSAVGNLSKAFEGQSAAAAQAGTGGITQLKNAVGDLQEIIGGQIIENSNTFTSGLKRMVVGLNDILKTNFSDELRTQKFEIKDLGEKLNDTNLSSQDRLDIITQMQAISPTFLQGLTDEEKLHADIATELDKQNAAFDVQIKQQVELEKTRQLQEGISAATGRIAGNETDIAKLQASINGESSSWGLSMSGILETFLSISDSVIQISSFLPGINQLLKTSKEVQIELANQQIDANEKALESQKEQNKFLDKTTEAEKRYMDSVSETVKGLKTKTDIVKFQKTLDSDLSLAKQLNNKTEAEFILATQKNLNNKLIKLDADAAKAKVKNKTKDTSTAKAKADEQKLQDELALIKIQAIQDDKEREIALLNFKRDQKIKEIELTTATEETKSALIHKIKQQALQDQFDIIDEFAAVQTEKDNQTQAEAEQKREEDIAIQADKKKTDDDKRITEEERVFNAKLQIAKSFSSSLGAIDAIAKNLGIKNVAFQKSLAVSQIAINTAIALIQMIKGSTTAASETGVAAPITLPLFIAEGTAIVLGAVASATAALKKAPDVSAAGGADFVTSKPTLLMVGDNPGGQERVTVQPLSGSGQTHYSPDSGVIHMAGGGTLTTRPQLGSDTFAQLQAVDAIRAIQNPVVGVEEIRDAMNNVEVTENRITI